MIVGLVGLGRMGGAFGRVLLSKGFNLVVYDVVRDKVNEFVKLGATGASSPADLASRVDIVLTNVPRSEDVLDVYLGGNGILSGAKPGLIAVETSTTDIKTKLRVAEECRRRNVGFIVAMLGKTVPQAERGETPLFVGGPEEVFRDKRVQEVFQAISSGRIYYMRTIEAAVAFKLITNSMGFAQLLTFLEGLLFIQKFGISIEEFLEAARDTAAYNYWFDARREKILKEDYSAYFSIDYIIKDLMYTLEEAKELGCPLPATALALQYYVAAKGMGYGGEDGIALIKLLRESCKK
ncbi:NAD(P)-dependent oxidoreductase [Caldivirga maquilingensis]|uniref:6-phosphogluconate dehydrogenase NAD-binding n=1 Tax=Caldivirga maquilingensis (strain ATCC 700844 / DSM 13496 / JCM 10307 / IC-167) TaxID=397948 RepID=A8MAZ7_CALMQ|nr:NAD(P)-dependent oxidoreductase [Caldivirga maquilingensis]ABW02626.1 6-phosphogluconate dehydrogenase NAD-binding [Caldivirga maquilingensis IC-167]